MKRFFAISVLLLFSFCSKNEKQPYPRILTDTNPEAVSVNTKTMLHRSLDTGEVFFIGNFDRNVSVARTDLKEDEKYHKKFKSDTVFPRCDLKIIIDTSYTFAAKGFEHRNIGFRKNGRIDYPKVFSLWKDYVECYPLLIYNNGSKAAYSTNHTRLIQQAKDVDGKWKPIEFFANSPSCLPYTNFYEHAPKRYSALSIIKYHGNFKTKIRVKIEIAGHVYYSNEIHGFINRTQFDQTMARNVLRFYCQFCDGSAPVSEERLAFAFLEHKR